jgi:hypothetical protein
VSAHPESEIGREADAGDDGVPTPGEHGPTPTDELLAQVHRSATVRAESRLDAVVSVARDDLIGCLESLLPLDAARRRDWSVWFAVWSAADTSDVLDAEHRRWLRALRIDLRRVAVAAVASGRLPSVVDVDAVVRAAIGRVYEIGVQAVLDAAAWPPSRQRSLIRQWSADVAHMTPPR